MDMTWKWDGHFGEGDQGRSRKISEGTTSEVDPEDKEPLGKATGNSVLGDGTALTEALRQEKSPHVGEQKGLCGHRDAGERRR